MITKRTRRLFIVAVIIAMISAMCFGITALCSGKTVDAYANGYDNGYSGGMAGDGYIRAYGVDVSEHQGIGFNFWNLKNSGKSYVILRAGFVSRKDYRFEEYYQAARAAGLDIGVYFYSYATTPSAASYEADRCLSYIAGKKFEYPVYFDFEDASARGSDAYGICRTFLDKIANAGYLAGLYGYASWMDTNYSGCWVDVNAICGNKYELWMANYVNGSPTNSYSSGYPYRYGAYQYTSTESIAGYNLDANVSYKDYPAIVKTYGFNGYSSENYRELDPVVFNAGYYRSRNTDLAGLDDSALKNHWREHGISEGRCASPAFDPAFYLLANSDVRVAYGENNYAGALDHFLSNGIKEGRDSSELFSFRAYKNNYGDLRNAFGDDNYSYYKHFATNGYGELRTAGIINGVYTIGMHEDSNYKMDIDGQSEKDGAQLKAMRQSFDDSQSFAFERQASGAYTIRNLHSNKYLEILYAGANGEYKVTQCRGTGDNCQQWYVVASRKDDSYSFINRTTHKAMDLTDGTVADGTDIQTWINDSNNVNQMFWLTPETPLTDGVYKLGAKNNADFVLNVSGNSHDDGANVWVWDRGNDQGDKWVVQAGMDGYYTLRETGSNKYLDVANGSLERNANAQIYSGNGSDSQKWTVVPNEDGTYTFYSKVSLMALDLDNGQAQNGQNVHIWSATLGDTQKWYMQMQSVLADGVYYIGNQANPLYRAEIAEGSRNNGGNFALHVADGHKRQEFTFARQEDGYYTITNVFSGLLLDVADGGKTTGTNIRQYEKKTNHAEHQRWSVLINADGSYTMVSAANGLTMDLNNGDLVDGNNIMCWTGNGRASQKWFLNSAEGLPEDGVYTIASAIDMGYRADISGPSTENSATIHLWEQHDGDSQKFIFNRSDDGYYTITSVYSMKCLDVAWGSTEDGADVWQYENNGTEGQKYLILLNADGSCSLIAGHSGKAVDLCGSVVNNGTNIDQWTYGADAPNQRWVLTEGSHVHSYTETVVEPTETEGGYTLHSCICGHTYKDNFTSVIVIDPVDPVDPTEPSDSENPIDPVDPENPSDSSGSAKLDNPDGSGGNPTDSLNPNGGDGAKKANVGLIVGTVVPAVLIVVGGITAFLIIRKKRRGEFDEEY